jgi:uncharacterized damage-inducible protein DinB
MPINAPLIAEFKNESVNTRKMIERVPTEKLNWQPHEKSMTLGRLANHIADLPIWFDRIINSDVFDFATFSFPRESKENTAAILDLFDQRKEAAIKLLESSSDETLNSPWTSKSGDHIFFTLPKKVAVRNFCYNHIYHHRGQLSVYLRLLDVPVPGMYGPSADERM